ncbi:hypothetical protein DERF_010290 [Dermatophagoides farinae]|uniref:Uncharacterized protein n=1 Tax=Dermatophagoides farinae TaxID=6954 RepID=A0A922HVL6_DERFA|nr:hypothetical protein DERF_010290 [Dermatophagoides farinae]
MNPGIYLNVFKSNYYYYFRQHQILFKKLLTTIMYECEYFNNESCIHDDYDDDSIKLKSFTSSRTN